MTVSLRRIVFYFSVGLLFSWNIPSALAQVGGLESFTGATKIIEYYHGDSLPRHTPPQNKGVKSEEVTWQTPFQVDQKWWKVLGELSKTNDGIDRTFYTAAHLQKLLQKNPKFVDNLCGDHYRAASTDDLKDNWANLKDPLELRAPKPMTFVKTQPVERITNKHALPNVCSVNPHRRQVLLHNINKKAFNIDLGSQRAIASAKSQCRVLCVQKDESSH